MKDVESGSSPHVFVGTEGRQDIHHYKLLSEGWMLKQISDVFNQVKSLALLCQKSVHFSEDLSAWSQDRDTANEKTTFINPEDQQLQHFQSECWVEMRAG